MKFPRPKMPTPGTVYSAAREGMDHDMIVRGAVLLAGVVAVIVGVAGLLTPVSVSPGRETVPCGSVIAPDLSAARAEDDQSAANIAVDGQVATDTNYTRLCQMNIADRRIWTITLAAAGALAIVGAVGVGVFSHRARRS